MIPMDKDFEFLDTDLLLAELDDMFQYACQSDRMDLLEYLAWTKESGFNHLISVLWSRLKNNE